MSPLLRKRCSIGNSLWQFLSLLIVVSALLSAEQGRGARPFSVLRLSLILRI
jgi:hypothetical protein